MPNDNDIVTITLLGAALPYRHRSALTGHRYLPARQRDQLAALRLAASEAMDGRAMLTTGSTTTYSTMACRVV
jgi:hypothetical protein